MSKRLDLSFLRNPGFILTCVLLLQLPGFLKVCNIEISNSGILWNDAAECGQEFLFVTFLQQSMWSLLLVISVFESFGSFSKALGLNMIPSKLKDLLFFQLRLLVPVAISAIVYLSFTYLLAYLFGHEIAFFDGIGPKSIVLRVFLVGFGGINVGLLFAELKFRRNPLEKEIEVHDELTNQRLKLHEVKWFEKKGRNYFANTGQEEFRIDSNLSKLEQLLDDKVFMRLNRAVIANVSSVKTYAYWENEKYIVHMDAGKEFVVTRKRVVELKSRLSKIE